MMEEQLEYLKNATREIKEAIKCTPEFNHRQTLGEAWRLILKVIDEVEAKKPTNREIDN